MAGGTLALVPMRPRPPAARSTQKMTCSWVGVLKIEIECWLALADIAHLQSYSRDIVWNDKFNLAIIRTVRRYDLVQVVYRGL